MKVVFYSNRMEFDRYDMETVGMGGSESALCNIVNNWIKQFPKDEIIIYNGKKEKKKYNDNVIFKTIKDFDNEKRNFDVHAFISLRDHQPFFEPFIDAKFKFMWSQDNMKELSLQILNDNEYAKNNIDGIFVISNHSKNDIGLYFNKPIYLQRNGYNDDWINWMEVGSVYRKPIAVYSSTPFRGLDILAELWPYIYNGCKERGVEPILKVFSSMSLYQQSDDNFRNLYNKLKSLPNVDLVGAIPQKKLYEELHKARTMLYSNNFEEAGCMAVLEALACGVEVITTDLGALAEQVKNGVNGYTIKGNAYSEEYQKQFIELGIKSLHSNDCGISITENHDLIFSWKDQARLMRETIIKEYLIK